MGLLFSFGMGAVGPLCRGLPSEAVLADLDLTSEAVLADLDLTSEAVLAERDLPSATMLAERVLPSTTLAVALGGLGGVTDRGVVSTGRCG